MVTVDQLLKLDDASLANLRANANRLQAGEGARREAAATLLPLIEAEIAKNAEVVSRPSRKAQPDVVESQGHRAERGRRWLYAQRF
jgi:hypothetical protein